MLLFGHTDPDSSGRVILLDTGAPIRAAEEQYLGTSFPILVAKQYYSATLLVAES